MQKRLDFFSKYLASVERRLAKQLGLSYADYINLRAEDYWLVGDDIVRYGFADGIVEDFYYEEPEEKDENFLQFLFGLF